MASDGMFYGGLFFPVPAPKILTCVFFLFSELFIVILIHTIISALIPVPEGHTPRPLREGPELLHTSFWCQQSERAYQVLLYWFHSQTNAV